MAIDFTVRRPTRRCAALDRDLAPGEAFVSLLIEESGEVVRQDYSAQAWKQAPEGTIAWWRGQMPAQGDATPAPREVLLSLLDEWADHPEEASARYLLALLLVRRRVLRLASGGFLQGLRGEEDDDPSKASVLTLVCRERDEPLDVAIVQPTEQEAPLIQQRLSELLGAA